MDDYREEFEPSQPRGGLGEAVLTEYRGTDRQRSRFNRRWLIAALIAGLVALLLVLGLWGGSDDDGGDGKAGPSARRSERQGRRPRWGGGGRSPARPWRTSPIPSSSN